MILRWFTSRTARQGRDMGKHVEKILAAQRDIISAAGVDAVTGALQELRGAVRNGTEEDIKNRMTELESAANDWLKAYPNPGIRENVEVLLVALSVAMAIRTFFVQPFKIPTGSMQPTLFGVTYENLNDKPGTRPPEWMSRIYQACIAGVFYHYQAAEDVGELARIGPPETFLRFFHKQSLLMHYPSGNKIYTFWLTPEDGFVSRSGNHAGIEEGQKFKKGEPIVNFKEIAGDHLFVDRLSYNFRRPHRGDIIVFETRGIGNGFAHLPPDQFYIKRMVAMGNEQVQIGNDRHLVIDGKRLDKSTPHFENVYAFDPSQPAEDARRPTSHYSGHINQFIANQDENLRNFQIAPLFPDQSTVYTVPAHHYMVMGDNTANSFDSRAWGDFSRTNVIGKYFFVYWPFTSRFGWNIR